MPNQDCPLCHVDAEFTQISANRKHFKCRNCTEFVISQSAEDWFNGRAPSTLQAYATEAANTSNPDFIYVITGRLPDSEPQVEIEGHPRPRSEVL